MGGSHTLLRGTMVLAMGQVTSYGLSIGRNIILARMLSRADFGLATVFGMTLSLLEVAGRMSLGQQIIQSKDGDSDSFQATSHAFQFVLAVAGALLVVSLSYPVAQAFDVPEATWAFMLLAVVPLSRGLEHLDYGRQQRALNYLPAVLCETVPQAVITLAAWPLAVWLRDFTVIVWLMIGKATLGILMTHLLSKHAYRWAWQWDYVKGMWAFGWPLLLTGVVIFASQQADQVVVGAFLSLDDLGAYALALSLVSIPWLIVAQVGSSLTLPILSRAQDDPQYFRRLYRTCVEFAAVGSVLLTLPLIVAGEKLVTLFFGSKYIGTGVLIAILGAASAIRLLRLAPSMASIARADTMNQLYSNVWRSSSLALATAVAVMGGGMALIAACALAAELLAAAISVIRLRKRQGVPLSDTAAPSAYVLGFVTGGLLLYFLGASLWGNWIVGGTIFAILAGAVVVAFIALSDFARMAKRTNGLKWLLSFRQRDPSSRIPQPR